jgi:hypothetical protein
MRNGTSPQRHFSAEENASLRDALESLRARLRERHGKEKISDAKLGKEIGVTGPAVTKYLSGGGFSREAAESLAQRHGKNLQELLGKPTQVFLISNVPDPELRAVLEYFAGRQCEWSEAAVGAAIGLSREEGLRQTREEWEALLMTLTSKLAKPR